MVSLSWAYVVCSLMVNCKYSQLLSTTLHQSCNLQLSRVCRSRSFLELLNQLIEMDLLEDSLAAIESWVVAEGLRQSQTQLVQLIEAIKLNQLQKLNFHPEKPSGSSPVYTSGFFRILVAASRPPSPADYCYCFFCSLDCCLCAVHQSVKE